MELFKKLKLNPKNPRKISEESLEKLKESILFFPQMLEKRPIVYDNDFVVLGGNQRLKAVRILVKKNDFKLKDLYFKFADGWTEEQKREFVIKDNISDGVWDAEILRKDWNDLPLESWGLNTSDWDEKKVVEDEAPAVAESEPDSKLGEVYQLGRHQLMCGDATKIEDVERLMGRIKADMVFIDPPYNVNYVGYTDNKLTIKNDNIDGEKFENLLFSSFTNCNICTKDGASMYVCHPSSQQIMFEQQLKKAGYSVRNQIIWAKNNFA